MRPTIALLLTSALAIGGCDRQSGTAGQANVAAPAAESLGAAAANEAVVEEVIGTLERGHKGEAAPAVEFQLPSGEHFTLADFQGKPVLLNLWATWCVPCVAEMPTLDRLAGTLGDRVHVLTISQDLEGAARVTPFFAKAGYKQLKPYLDNQAGFSLAMGINLPTTILYDSQGKEVWRMLGGMDWTSETARELIAEAG